MAYKTGKQVFQDLILSKINNTVKVNTIVLDSDPQFDFTVCDTKWMQPGQSFTDKNGNIWAIAEIDQSTNTVYALKPSPSADLDSGDFIQIQLPVFKHGTPRTVEGEEANKMAANVAFVTPLVWLVDPIQYEDAEYGSSPNRTFEFNFYCLDTFDENGDLNEDRHANIIYPMTQLNEAIREAIDNGIGIERTGRWRGVELSRLGKETKNGFESYIFSMNLSGIASTTSVKVDSQLCCC